MRAPHAPRVTARVRGSGALLHAGAALHTPSGVPHGLTPDE